MNHTDNLEASTHAQLSNTILKRTTFLRCLDKHCLTWLRSQYTPAIPCRRAGVWTQQPGCHPFERTAKPGGERDQKNQRETGSTCVK